MDLESFQKNKEIEKGRNDTQIIDTLSFKMLLAANRMVRAFNDGPGKTFDIPLTDWRCAMVLASSPDSSGEQVSRFLEMDKMAISRGLRGLQKAGLATVKADPTNRRRQLWSLTAKGWTLYDTIVPMVMARDETIFGTMSDEDKSALAAAFERVSPR
ncbi:MarR family winged helix-turn-helix transcriptional regulator [Lentibacter algarum]|uniref:MarR family winged helix-turn-helix transcriptional regulator n=1 Tax=Lentibacter algarum TaxID=576131 RepID=UPI001C080AA1|nr:MarR family winged helix-turn-helix transcriptional regulator [Lentibacter algarum]MBU2982823.1 MarR family winged helix-turn-helix transcriptional regulator [Lentibacter algarum]